MKQLCKIFKKIKNGEMLSEMEQRYWELYLYDAKVVLTVSVLSIIAFIIFSLLIIRAL